jgi:hypothetical protein
VAFVLEIFSVVLDTVVPLLLVVLLAAKLVSDACDEIMVLMLETVEKACDFEAVGELSLFDVRLVEV